MSATASTSLICQSATLLSTIASDGAVLVRPDRFIAWRHPAGTGDPRAALAAVLSQILARVFTTLRLRKTQDKCHVKVSGTEEP